MSDFKSLLSIFFPPKCIFCRQIIPHESSLKDSNFCGKCTPVNKSFNCPLCGEHYNKCLCKNNFDKIISLFEYSGNVKKAIINFKITLRQKHADVFAAMLHTKLSEHCDKSDYSIITFVPSSAETYNKLKTNQAQIISQSLASLINLPVISNLISRKSGSAPQHTLGFYDRVKNADTSFYLCENAPKLQGKNVILIDDVHTTGASLNKCSTLLRTLGAGKIIALTCANTPKPKMEKHESL